MNPSIQLHIVHIMRTYSTISTDFVNYLITGVTDRFLLSMKICGLVWEIFCLNSSFSMNQLSLTYR